MYPSKEQCGKELLATNATTDTFETEVLESDGKVIVDFWAEWCGPCHAVSPVLDRIADEHDVKLVKVNIDEQQDLAMRYGVASIPFMVLFENGQPHDAAEAQLVDERARLALERPGAEDREHRPGMAFVHPCKRPQERRVVLLGDQPADGEHERRILRDAGVERLDRRVLLGQQ